MEILSKKIKKVMVFGSFDIIHKGHLNFFKQSKEYGDYLIIVLARDKTIEYVKGRKPYYPEKKRKKHLKELGIAQKILLGSLTDKFAAIRRYRPETITLGHDQKFFTDKLENYIKKRLLNIRLVRLKPYKRHIYRSSLLRKKSEAKDSYKSN